MIKIINKYNELSSLLYTKKWEYHAFFVYNKQKKLFRTYIEKQYCYLFYNLYCNT